MPPSRYSAPRSQVIRYTGETQFKEGDWVGVELAKALGKNDGSVQGVVYFECDQEFGLFVRPNNVAVSVYEAMHGDSDVGRPHSRLYVSTLSTLLRVPLQCSRQLSRCIPTCQVYCAPSAIRVPCPFHALALSTLLPFPFPRPFHSLTFPIPSTPSSHSPHAGFAPLLTARYLFPPTTTFTTVITLSHPKAYSDQAMAAATIQAFQRGGVSVTASPAHTQPHTLLPASSTHRPLYHMMLCPFRVCESVV